MSVRRASQNFLQTPRSEYCCKHLDRLASYQLTTKTKTKAQGFYCQKCSIMLASQGHNVVKINHNQRQSQNQSHVRKSNRYEHRTSRSTIIGRKNEIATFMQGLECTMYKLQSKLEEVQEHLLSSQISHGRLIEQANLFYRQLQEQIELQKYTTYNCILNKRSLDQTQPRRIRQVLMSAMEEIENIVCDIKQNMDAVETVDYAIYCNIIGGYQDKSQKVQALAKGRLDIKGYEECLLILPEIPKSLKTLSEKISISFGKSNTTTSNNSINFGIKPQRIMRQQSDIYLSEPSFSENQNVDLQSTSNYRTEIISQNEKVLFHKGNRQIIKSHGNVRDIAFSFDQNSNNSKQLIINTDCHYLGNEKNLLKEFQEGKLSKIEERINCKEIYESRESLGEYLDFSQSRDRQNSIQDAETLLLA